MSDTSQTPPAAVSETEKILSKFNDALDGHKRLTLDELAKLKREMEDAVRGDTEATKKELNDLRDALKSATDWIDSEVKARADQGRVKDNESTIVVPPNDVTPPVPAPVADQTPAGGVGEDGKRKGGLKRFW